MGLDKMKKDAVYDSLIDASKIVSEEGADLKGSIRSGNLQNRIIQAISGQLDKSAALKKQIDAAVLKGEIEKDINKTKLTSFQEQIKFIKENPNDPLAKKLSGATSVADNLAALADKPITSDIVQRLVESKGQAVKGQVRDDKYQKWEKNNEGKDEIDYLQDVYKGQTLDAGIYIINKKAIRIDEGGNAFPVDLDSIIG
jgi:predicted O-linked N-acetylglucosamine transferase (SPINDLY family)